MNNLARRKKMLFLLIIACALWMRIIPLLITDNYHGIAAGKIIEAQRLLKNPNSLNTWIVPAHGPVHLYLLALALKLSKGAYIGGCILSLLFGLLVLIPYFKLLRLIFNDEVAILSAFLLAFFPLHIVYSALSTAETTFLFFLFLGLFFYAKYKKGHALADLCLAAVSLGLSSVCRFEGGLFIPIILILLIKERKRALVFLAVSSLLPVMWMYGNYLISGNFLQFLYASDSIVKTEFAFQKSIGNDFNFFQKTSFWVMQFKGYFGLPVFICGLSGLAFYGFKRRYRDLTVIFLGMLGFFTYKTAMEELAMQPRYGMSLGMLFVPFAMLFFTDFLKTNREKFAKPLFLLFIIYTILRCAYLESIMLPKAPYWIKQAALFLRDNTQAGETVYIETEEDNLKAPLKLYSGLPIDQFIDYNPFAQDVELLTPEGRKNLKFIVLISRRKLKNQKLVFKYKNCKIYQKSKNVQF